MNIKAEIKGIQYKPFSVKDLKEILIDKFDINEIPPSCLIQDQNNCFSISKWVSPKRTRSYPYERIYNTLSNRKKVTVIPIIKDEGLDGDRDYIQWDTISLMSLLDVYVIFAYYVDAEKNLSYENKITKQLMDNDYVISKLREISDYHSSALHWNLKEIKKSLPGLVKKVRKFYSDITVKYDVKMHDERGLLKFEDGLLDDVKDFMEFSRSKAKEAQTREFYTQQPKEVLSTLSKAKITIKNYLGGLYYFTTDEILIDKDKLYLIEAKHSNSKKLPSISDIRDGLLKMILYCNLNNVTIDDASYNSIPVLKLTSPQIKKGIVSNRPHEEIRKFYTLNDFSRREKSIIENLVNEARYNKFLVEIKYGVV